MMTRTQILILFFSLLVGTMLACNIPLSTPDILSAPVTPTLSYEPTDVYSNVTPTRTSRPTRTPVPTDDPDKVTETETPLPTFTPLALAATVTPPGNDSDENNSDEEEPTDTEEDEGEETVTPESEFESLELAFEQTWELRPDDPGFALANVVLTATGGDEDYTYFRDDKQQPGAEFEYRWKACVDNTGTFRVDSGDGQSVTLDFAEKSPCSE